MKSNQMDKRAQIATTFTWFFAFVIIFFIIIIFLSATLVMSKSKSVLYGNDEIVLEGYSGDMRSQEILLNIFENKLNYKGDNLKVKDLILKWRYALDSNEKNSIKETLNNKFNDILNQTLEKGECYVFKAEYGLGDVEGTIKKISGMQGSNSYSDFVQKNTVSFDSLVKNSGSYSAYAEKIRQNSFDKAVTIILLDENTKNQFLAEMNKKEQVKIKFYIGECS